MSEGAFMRAFSREMKAATREFWEENTAALLAYANDRMFPSQMDRDEAKTRVARCSDKQLSTATLAVAEADARRCTGCGRDS